MFEVKRCHLGSSITKSPAQLAREWCIHNFSRLIFSAISVFLWFGVYYVGCGIWTFMLNNLADVKPEVPEETIAIFNSPLSGVLKLIGAVCVVIYVIASTRKTK